MHYRWRPALCLLLLAALSPGLTTKAYGTTAPALKAVLTLSALKQNPSAMHPDEANAPGSGPGASSPPDGSANEQYGGSVSESDESPAAGNDSVTPNDGAGNDPQTVAGSASAINAQQPVRKLRLPNRCNLRPNDLNACLPTDRTRLSQWINRAQDQAHASCCEALSRAQQRYGSASCALLNPQTLIRPSCGL